MTCMAIRPDSLTFIAEIATADAHDRVATLLLIDLNSAFRTFLCVLGYPDWSCFLDSFNQVLMLEVFDEFSPLLMLLTSQRVVVITVTSKTELLPTFAFDCANISLVDLYAVFATQTRTKLMVSVLSYHLLAHSLSPPL